MSEDSDEKYEPDAMDMTPMMVLKMAIDDINEKAKAGRPIPTKMLILHITDDEDKKEFEWNYHNAGMTFSQIIAMIEISKAYFVRELLPDKLND